MADAVSAISRLRRSVWHVAQFRFESKLDAGLTLTLDFLT